MDNIRSWFNSAAFASKSSVLPQYFPEGKAKVDPYLTELMNLEQWREVVVKKVIIYKTPLGKDLRRTSAEQQGADGPSRMRVHHHYLIVEVSPVDDQLSGFLIRAEKFGQDSDGHAKITVNHVASVGKGALEHHGKVFNLPMQFKHLIELLMAHSPHYDPLRDNCWKYAHYTFKALDTYKALEATQQATTRSVEVQRQGQSQLVPTNEGSMPRLVMPIDVMKQAGTGAALVLTSTTLVYCAYKGLQLLMSTQDEEEEEEENYVPSQVRS